MVASIRRRSSACWKIWKINMSTKEDSSSSGTGCLRIARKRFKSWLKPTRTGFRFIVFRHMLLNSIPRNTSGRPWREKTWAITARRRWEIWPGKSGKGLAEWKDQNQYWKDSWSNQGCGQDGSWVKVSRHLGASSPSGNVRGECRGWYPFRIMVRKLIEWTRHNNEFVFRIRLASSLEEAPTPENPFPFRKKIPRANRKRAKRFSGVGNAETLRRWAEFVSVGTVSERTS